METIIYNIEGLRIHTRKDRSSQDINVIGEVIKSDCYRLRQLKNKIQPRFILDVGGHIGTFGLWAKKFFPDAYLIAFEPNKISYELYCKNMKEHQHSKYFIFNKGIGYDKNLTCLMDGATATGGGMLKSKESALKLQKGNIYRIFSDTIEVETIEWVFDKFQCIGLDKFELSKWDAEGGEREAFIHMKDETAKKFQHMVGEFHVSGGYLKFKEIFDKKFPHLSMTSPYEHIKKNIGSFFVTPK